MRLHLLCILVLAIALTGCPKETKPSRATQSPPDRIRMAFHSPTQTMPAGAEYHPEGSEGASTFRVEAVMDSMS